MTTEESAAGQGNDVGEHTQTRYKRKLSNYLVDPGLQLRYTSAIVVVAAFLTAGLGWMIYQATRDTSEVIRLSGLVDEEMAAELSKQFSDKDGTVLWGIIGFGMVLVMSVSAAGILITHKIAGPLYNIQRNFRRVREEHMAPIRALRKGDELQDFFNEFREMHDAIRERVEDDLKVIGQVAAALEDSKARTPDQEQALVALRGLHKRKSDSLLSTGR
ncbi:MAG: hypothetical protein SGI86_09575 [Deltaproteobacteria bacterium]|nr:hypothetical protein [Deltaproteobacteria bacterium]